MFAGVGDSQPGDPVQRDVPVVVAQFPYGHQVIVERVIGHPSARQVPAHAETRSHFSALAICFRKLNLESPANPLWISPSPGDE